MSIEAMELALEALKFVNQTGDTQTFDMCYADKAITAIKAALAQPEQGWTPERIAGMKRLKDAQDKKLEQPEQEFVDYRAMYLKVRDELAELQQRNMTKEALTQLREVHAIQGRDGCWDIDDYMLGLYNGLELALSIVESRECRYKQRPKSQPEQEPVCDKDPQGCWNVRCQLGKKCKNTPPQRTWAGLTLTQVKLLWEGVQEEAVKSGDSLNWVFYTHINEALKEKNT